MKKCVYKFIVMAGLAIFTFSSLNALAGDESPVSAYADLTALTDYVWRGYSLSDDSIVIQPTATVSYNGFSFNLWGNIDTDSNDNAFNETDMTLSYDWSFDKFSMGVGYIYYALEGNDSQELYLSFGLDTILSPSLKIYRDFDEFDSWYISLGVGHSFAFSDTLALDLSAAVGYYDYDDYDYSELHDGSVTASMTFPVNKYISITPKALYTFGLSSKARDEIEDGDGDSAHLFGGITCAIAF
jgi:hypothetical protein